MITVIWDKPFSLNITSADPDIVYCIDICNVTNGKTSDHLVSNCTVLRTNFTYEVDSPDPTKLYQFIVTPRSNVHGARNGTKNSIEGRFQYLCKLSLSCKMFRNNY